MEIGQLISGLGSIATGGITGLVGAVVSNVVEVWKQKQQLDILKENHAHEQAMKDKDAAIMAQEWTQRTKIAQTEGDAAKDVAASGAFAKSFDTEPKSYAAGIKAPENGFAQATGWIIMVALDAIRGVIRPGLTLYLAWIATEMYNEQRALIAIHSAGKVDPIALALVHGRIVDTLLYLFTTCTLWWFGSRNANKAPR